MVAFRALLASVFVVAGLLPLVLLRSALPNRSKPGSTGFIMVVIGISCWSFGAAGLTAATTEGIAVAGFAFRIAGPVVSASGFFLLLAEYTGLLSPSRPVLAGVGLFVVAVQLLTWTNASHHLVYGPSLDLATDTIRFERMGPVWVVNTIVSYTFNTTAFLLGIVEVLRTSELRRQQTLTVIGAAIPPLALNVLAQFWVPLPFDPTVLGFVLTAFIMGWALYGGTFLDIVPVGRQRAVETMSDPVVVIDGEGRIVDSNPAARRLVDSGPDWKGMPADGFFAPFSEQVERFRDADDVATEITVRRNGERRHFDLDISPIEGPQGGTRGRLVVLREITQQKARERELDLMRQVQSRVLRHNIRNELQTIRGRNEVFADELDGEYAAMAATVVERSDALLQTSTKARDIERLLDGDQERRPVDLAALLSGEVETQREEFPGVAFTLDAPSRCVVETTPAIETAVENLIENAAAHNDATDPTVGVSLRSDRTAAVLTIADNGPGIPEQELAVLERGTETPLSHGSGMGLWVVDWVLEHTGASVAYDTGSVGTEITLRIPRNRGAGD